MGVVWRGHDRTTGTVYAIKILRPEYARDPMAVGRFVRERTALVALRHPNVVTVHDMIVEGEQLALVMDMVAGGDLDGLRRARGGRLAPAEAAALAAQVGDGLAAAHAAGIVHRDLKPANVLLGTDRVLLADFGIALLSDQTRVTSTGGVLGTPAYLPPEVISGQEPGPAGDVYALGITLYELLIGQPPFTGNTAAVLHAHGTAALQRAPGIPDALWAVVSGCLAKDPASRPQATDVAASAHAFAAAPASSVTAPAFAAWPRGAQPRPDTEQVVQQVPDTMAPPPLAAAPPRAAPSGRRRTMIIAAASVAAATLLAVGVITLAPSRPDSSAQQAQLAGSGQTVSPSASASAARAGQSSPSASSRASGSSGATGLQNGSPSPGNAQPSSPAGTSASSSSTGSRSTPSPATAPSSSGTPAPSGSTVTDADGFPILDASAGQQAHACAIIGSATDPTLKETVQGVVCADVITAAKSGGYTVQGQLQVYCQTAAAVDVQCADVIAQGQLANAVNGVVASTGAYQCGHSYGACATGRNYVPTGTYSYSGVTMSDCSSNGVSTTDVWGLALGSNDTRIELPGSDAWVSLSAANANDNPNQSTGHQYICP
jgi:serine/threonine protein kinase, bacterial